MTEPDPDRPPESPAVSPGADAVAGKPVAPQADQRSGGAGAADRAEASADAAQAMADARAAEADAREAEADARDAVAEGARKRPRPFAAVALLAVAAALLWASSRMTWVTLEVTSELGPPRTAHLNGSTWFGALTPLALVLLATIAAVFATHGWWRRGVGVVVAVLAAVAAVPAYALLINQGKTGDRAARLAELRGWEHPGTVTTSSLPAVLTLVGALAAFAAGLLLVRMPRETAGMSGKYDSPAVRKSAAAEQVAQHHVGQGSAESGSQPAAGEPLSGRVLWDALDEGLDPTDDGTNHSAAHDDPGTGGTRDNNH
ncbi:TIGR02234 family membrane protein [Nocardia tengchongensis]|uniref:TIGR02234 family membrane protein n=1 Tax=Nocardia tengchongensis TaxID=2055889 RepID=UPI003698D326